MSAQPKTESGLPLTDCIFKDSLVSFVACLTDLNTRTDLS